MFTDSPHDFYLQDNLTHELEKTLFLFTSFCLKDCMSRILTQLHEEMACLLRRYKVMDEPFPDLSKFALDYPPSDEEDDGWTTIGSKGKKFTEVQETHTDNGENSPISALFAGLLVSRSSYNKKTRMADKSTIGSKERFFVLPLDINSQQVSQSPCCSMYPVLLLVDSKGTKYVCMVLVNTTTLLLKTT